MRLSTSAPAIVIALAAIAALASCSASRTNSIPALGGAGAAPVGNGIDAQRSLVYVGDVESNFIAVFDRGGAQVGTITKGLNGPSGLFVDGGHNLWVANETASNVVEYARSGTSPIATLPDGSGNAPEDVTVCANGKVYVANVINGIAVYTGPKHHKSGSLQYDSAQFTGITCDRNGNVFATGVVGTNGTVIEFPNGQESGAHTLPISSSGNLWGIKPDNAGNLLVVGIPNGMVTEFTEAGAPTGRSIEMHGQWYEIALNREGTVLFGGDQFHNQGVAVTFPGDKLRMKYKSTFSKVLGVAFDH